MTKPNKLYDTTPPVMLVKIRLRLSGLYPRFARFFLYFPLTGPFPLSHEKEDVPSLGPALPYDEGGGGLQVIITTSF